MSDFDWRNQPWGDANWAGYRPGRDSDSTESFPDNESLIKFIEMSNSSAKDISGVTKDQLDFLRINPDAKVTLDDGTTLLYNAPKTGMNQIDGADYTTGKKIGNNLAEGQRYTMGPDGKLTATGDPWQYSPENTGLIWKIMEKLPYAAAGAALGGAFGLFGDGAAGLNMPSWGVEDGLLTGGNWGGAVPELGSSSLADVIQQAYSDPSWGKDTLTNMGFSPEQVSTMLSGEVPAVGLSPIPGMTNLGNTIPEVVGGSGLLGSISNGLKDVGSSVGGGLKDIANGVIGNTGSFGISDLMQLLGGIGAYNQQDDYRDLIQKQMDYMQDPNITKYRAQLAQSYEDPSSWLNGAEGQALANTTANRLERRDSAQGRLFNPVNRTADLENVLMGGLNNYRTGLNQSIQTAMGGGASLANLSNQYGQTNPYAGLMYAGNQILGGSNG